MLFKIDSLPGAETSRALPDEQVCRVKRHDDLLLACLVSDSQACKYAGMLNEDAFCLHPERRKILTRTLASLAK
jgi:hypothetical protein